MALYRNITGTSPMDYGSEGRAHKAGTVMDERLDSGLDSLREDETEDYCSAREEAVVDQFARLNVNEAHEERWRTEITEDGDTCVVTLIVVVVVVVVHFNTQLCAKHYRHRARAQRNKPLVCK